MQNYSSKSLKTGSKSKRPTSRSRLARSGGSISASREEEKSRKITLSKDLFDTAMILAFCTILIGITLLATVWLK